MKSIKKDFNKAASLYRSTCDDYQFSRSCHKFASYALTGKGGPADPSKAFDYFKENYLTDLIPETGNAGTFYLHPNKKGSEVLGKFWGEGIYQALFPR